MSKIKKTFVLTLKHKKMPHRVFVPGLARGELYQQELTYNLPEAELDSPMFAMHLIDESNTLLTNVYDVTCVEKTDAVIADQKKNESNKPCVTWYNREDVEPLLELGEHVMVSSHDKSASAVYLGDGSYDVFRIALDSNDIIYVTPIVTPKVLIGSK